MKRHNGRILTVLALYNMDLNNYNYDESIKCFDDIKNLEMEYEYQVEIDYKYSEKLFRGTLDHLDEINQIISASLTNYTLDRLSYVDRAIIRSATYEMKFEKIAKNIVIDEALLITREYSNLENNAQVKFNNRLLDVIAKNVYE